MHSAHYILVRDSDEAIVDRITTPPEELRPVDWVMAYWARLLPAHTVYIRVDRQNKE